MSSILKEKKYPSQYPEDAVKVLNAMSFSKGASIKIVGSQSLQSQLYAGDFDAYEIVPTKGEKEPALNKLAEGFQEIIKKLKSMSNVYIGDIKSGIIKEWDILVRNPTKKVESLRKQNIISEREALHALTLLKGSKVKAKQELKFHIIRWTPEEVLKGKKTLRDGSTYTLQEAFSSPTITKLDVIALVDKRYTEFSIIYEFHNNSTILNQDASPDPEKSLKESIKAYQEEGNLFKVIKRKFSLAKLKNKKSDIKKFSAILNSETGKLYTLYSDVKTLGDLMEAHSLPEQSLRQAFNNFTDRLRNIYAKDIHLKDKKELLLQLRSTKNLREIEKQLFNHLQRSAELRGGYSPIDC